jgi:hypothetical protein
LRSGICYRHWGHPPSPNSRCLRVGGASLPPPLTDPHERNSRMRFFVAQLRSSEDEDVRVHNPGRRQGKMLKHPLKPPPHPTDFVRTPTAGRYYAASLSPEPHIDILIRAVSNCLIFYSDFIDRQTH